MSVASFIGLFIAFGLSIRLLHYIVTANKGKPVPEYKPSTTRKIAILSLLVGSIILLLLAGLGAIHINYIAAGSIMLAVSFTVGMTTPPHKEGQ